MSNSDRCLSHIEAGRRRLENLWAAGTDYSPDVVERARRSNSMLHLDLDLTGECQLKCFYCDRTPDRFSDVPNRVELTTQQRIDLISEAKGLGATTVEFPGAGEPMIDTGFWQIVEHSHALKMTTVLFTSGYHLTKESVDRLYHLGVTVFLKRNSEDDSIQDKMVGVKGYGKTASSVLQCLIDRGFNRCVPTRLAIDMVVTPRFNESENFSAVVEMHRWCRRNNIHNYITTLIPEGRADKAAVLLERERSNRMIEAVRRVDEEEFGLRYSPARPMSGGYKCRQVNVGVFVNLFGEIYDCNGLGRYLGHVGINRLEEIWNSRFARHIREPLQEGYCLLRERVWDTVNSSGMQRKLEEYNQHKKIVGEDQVLEAGLEYMESPIDARPSRQEF